MDRRRPKRKIGQILLDANVVTEDELNLALKRQKDNGQRLGENLVDLGFLDDDEITQYVALQYGIPYISLDRYTLHKDLLNIIPEEMSETYGIIPLDLIGDILTVGIVEMPDEIILKRLEEFVGFRIRVLLVTASDFNRYMERAYGLSVADCDNLFHNTEVGNYIRTPSYEGRERRRYPRFNMKVRLKYEYKDEFNINSSLNISQGGVLIKSRSPVPVNTHLVIRVELPGSQEELIIITRVVRVERPADENVYFIALGFSAMDTKDSRRFVEFIDSMKKTGA